MTRGELAKYLGVYDCDISHAVTELLKENPDALPKQNRKISLNAKELSDVCRHVNGISELQLILLEETVFKDPDVRHPCRTIGEYIDGNEEFIERQKNDKSIHVCGNCAYCIGKSRIGKTSRVLPYCSFYEKFVYSFRVEKDGKEVMANVFEDGCETWIRGEPRLWKNYKRIRKGTCFSL